MGGGGGGGGAAFEQLFDPVRGEFEQKISKNSNARGVAGGGMLKLRFDWYIICQQTIFFEYFLGTLVILSKQKKTFVPENTR